MVISHAPFNLEVGQTIEVQNALSLLKGKEKHILIDQTAKIKIIPKDSFETIIHKKELVKEKLWAVTEGK